MENRQQFIDNHARILVVERVVLLRTVGGAVPPFLGVRLGLVGAAARIDEHSDHHRNLAAVDEIVHDVLGADVAFGIHVRLAIVVDHQRGWNLRIVLLRNIDPIGVLGAWIRLARQREGAFYLAVRHALLGHGVRAELVIGIRVRSFRRRRWNLCERDSTGKQGKSGKFHNYEWISQIRSRTRPLDS